MPSLRTMMEILDTIDESIANGRPVYVHCLGGRGRTGMVVGCYLVRHGLDGRSALKRIEALRRLGRTEALPSPETRSQRELVLNWARHEYARKVRP